MKKYVFFGLVDRRERRKKNSVDLDYQKCRRGHRDNGASLLSSGRRRLKNPSPADSCNNWPRGGRCHGVVGQVTTF